MSELSFNTQKEDTVSSEIRSSEYGALLTSAKLIEDIVAVEQERPELVRAAFRKERLDSYILMTQPGAAEEIIDQQQQIIEIVNKITLLLKSLMDDFSDPIEAESVFANIMQYQKYLWQLRKGRDLQFKDVLVSLESAIRYYDTTELTLDKINVLIEIFEGLKDTYLQSDFLQMARKKLRQAGFDLTRPASGAPEKFLEILKRLKEDA